MITSADDWADALDTHMKETGKSAGTLTSEAYAAGTLLGVTLDPAHPAADDERPHLASADGWVIRYAAKYGWWEAVTWSVWTLAYEADGSDDAAWALRYGTGADTVVYEVSHISPDHPSDAQAWAEHALAAHHGVAITGWTPHRPGPGTAPAYWTAQERP